MSFDSLTYLLFLPAVVLLHWLCPSRYRWAVLLIASYVFYASWNISLSLLILGVTGCTYLAGLLLERASSRPRRRLTLAVSLVLCLGVLGTFKYADLIGRSLAALTGETWDPLNIILPVGISFYTFQAMSYVIDVYRGSIKAERHFGYYALYISFFPQLVAGPIERAGALIPQLRRDRMLASEDITAGLRLIISGFFRKIAVADMAAPFVDAVYGSTQPDGSAVLIATLLFAVQIYCDFSGYSEIAAGSARLLGIRLMRNFDQPYAAANIREFWRKWHISLTVWFTDYVYIPLGGSRKGLPRQLFATAVVFLLCGLWHGADWTFVIWGLLHAVFMMANIAVRRLRSSDQPRFAGRILTLAAVCFAWLFFRAENIPHAFSLLSRLFSPWHWEAGIRLLMDGTAVGLSPAVLVCLLISLLLVIRRLPALAYGESTETSDIIWAGLLLAIAAAVLIRLDSGTASAFIYFQF